jgi:anti-sigma regulatory factor (Ser/Thr protein kinase)
VDFQLSVGSRAPSLARAIVATEIDQELSLSSREILGLLTTELVSNAVRHTGMKADQEIVLRLLNGGKVRVEVVDEGPGFERKTVDDGENGGYGLKLVDRLASSWGVRADAGRNIVWFELDDRPTDD